MHPIDGRILTTGRRAVAKVPYFSFAQNISKLIFSLALRTFTVLASLCETTKEKVGLQAYFFFGTPGRSRTCNPFLRTEQLYPLSYRGIVVVYHFTKSVAVCVFQ